MNLTVGGGFRVGGWHLCIPNIPISVWRSKESLKVFLLLKESRRSYSRNERAGRKIEKRGGGELDCRQHNVKTLRLLLLILGEREREIWKSHFLSCPGLTRGALLGRMGLDGNKTNDLSLPANITPHPYTTQLSRVYETFVIRWRMVTFQVIR